jgi:hypothetical protein
MIGALVKVTWENGYEDDEVYEVIGQPCRTKLSIKSVLEVDSEIYWVDESMLRPV